jgi:hypothetical protein
MTQAKLELDTPPAQAADRTGFDIGWDHAHHGLVPPAELLHAGTPVCQGWIAGRAVFGQRVLATHRATRLWLQLRLLAWRHGIAFETQQVTPNFLAQIHTPECPVLRLPLGGAASDPAAAQVERLNPDATYAAGNLAVISRQAARVRDGVDVAEAVRRARRAEAGGEPESGLDAAVWWRLAALRSYATPLPFHEAARLPLAVLPPNRVRLLNAVQGLQALVTRLFAAPGWSMRTRALGALLPEHTLRHDFNLFVGAIAPRVLEAGAETQSVRRALEDAWLNERVQRRWQHLVFSLGPAGVEALLAQATAQGLAPVRILSHASEQAIEGWALRPAPRAARRRTAPPPPVPVSRGSASRLHAAR